MTLESSRDADRSTLTVKTPVVKLAAVMLAVFPMSPAAIPSAMTTMPGRVEEYSADATEPPRPTESSSVMVVAVADATPFAALGRLPNLSLASCALALVEMGVGLATFNPAQVQTEMTRYLRDALSLP